jgi:SulP family sulfate permease
VRVDWNRLQDEWIGNWRGDLLAGLVVALALIPEAIAFSIIAGVDPKVGLYASFSIAVVTAIAAGRPGMISAATAATAVLMVTLVRDHGLQYLLAATVLAGVIQVGRRAAAARRAMRFVSRSVLTGFVNALAILIFMAQIPEMIDVPMLTYPLVALGSRSSTCCRWPPRRSRRRWWCIIAITGARSGSAGTCAPSATWASCPTRCPSS